MPPVSANPTEQAKRAALDAVLASRSLDRSDQLKRFLRYICEAEIAGRGQDLTEYSIGVDALGRPRDFSPNDDSSVRNRAFALRKKLEEFYEEEAPGAAVRIELPKGSYLPRFVTAEALPEPPLELPVAPIPPADLPQSRPATRWLLAAAGLGVLVGAALVLLLHRDRLIPPVPPALAAAWGGMLQPGTHVLVSVATPMHAYIREFPQSAAPAQKYYPVSPDIRDWFTRYRHGPRPDDVLMELPTFNSPLWGDAAGAFRVARMLQRYGADPELLAERLVSPPVFRDRNTVMLGNAEYSQAIQQLLRKMPLGLRFDPATRDHEVFEVGPDGNPIHRFEPKRTDRGALLEVFGLITFLPSQGTSDQHARTIIISGITSAGTEAAAEYLTSASRMEDLSRRMGLKPGAPWPSRLQVLVRAATDQTIALSSAYETHRVVN